MHISDSAGAVLTRVDPPAGTIVINRPSRRNALSRQLIGQLLGALDDLLQERRVRAVIMTGADPAFCAGTDLHEIHQSQQSDDAAVRWSDDAKQLCDLMIGIVQYPKPIIACVNGPSLGAGLALTAACDLAVASSNAVFGLPEVRRGLTSSLALPLLQFRLGAAHTANFALRGHQIDAHQALRIGLVQKTVEHDQLWAQGKEIAGEVALGSANAISLTKRVLNETVGEHLMSQLYASAAATASARTTDDATEGVDAFHAQRRGSNGQR